MSLPEAEFMRLAWFPITIHQNDTLIIQEGKLFVTHNHVIVVNDNKDVILSEPLVELAGSIAKGYTITTEENTYAAINSVGCGCGSRLRSYNPYRGVPHVSQL